MTRTIKTRLIIAALVVAILAGIAAFVGLYLLIVPRLFSNRPAIQNTSTVVLQVQGLSQLVTVKYVMEKVVVLEDVRWYGENRVMLIAHGVVHAGVNLQRLRPEDVQVSGKKVYLRLPPAEILSTHLDEQKTRVLEHQTGLLRTFDKELQQDARRQAVDDIQRAARYAGILPDAEERARQQLDAFLRHLGWEVELK